VPASSVVLARGQNLGAKRSRSYRLLGSGAWAVGLRCSSSFGQWSAARAELGGQPPPGFVCRPTDRADARSGGGSRHDPISGEHWPQTYVRPTTDRRQPEKWDATECGSSKALKKCTARTRVSGASSARGCGLAHSAESAPWPDTTSALLPTSRKPNDHWGITAVRRHPASASARDRLRTPSSAQTRPVIVRLTAPGGTSCGAIELSHLTRQIPQPSGRLSPISQQSLGSWLSGPQELPP